jgi:quinohemoprotein ethanol dehydrogenase
MVAARLASFARAGLALVVALALGSAGPPADSAARLADASDGSDWAGYGRTFGQQHFSPLEEVNQSSVADLGLAWSMDLPLGNTAIQPIAVDGVLYFATGLSVVHAVDAVTGRELWQYDPKPGERGGLNLRFGWGVRGIAWWDGKIYTGTQDGRLIAIDAKTGKPVWSVQTFPTDYPAYISGAPRVFGGKVIVGFGSTTGAARGYVTAYDAGTGRQAWRFWTVPGDPAKGFENRAMAKAAKTWAGEWWKKGGGGVVWNAIAYDAETDTVFIGTGSGYPWNRAARSDDEGDNLFICSIVALSGKTGAYKWHYQVNPGETWDFDAAMDIELADIPIAGRPRKVLIQAPKNGFFYVIDRITGKLISAEPFAPVTWATGIDKVTGRPIEAPGVRYGEGQSVTIRPTAMGAHSWLPMAWSPRTQLVYIPTIDFEMGYTGTAKGYQVPRDRTLSGGNAVAGGLAMGRTAARGGLLAWSPARQQAVWKVEHPTFVNGGVLATGGGLVFQGTVDNWFKAYAADSGKVLWQFDAKSPLMATPITYRAGGRQYVTMVTGLGMNNATNLVAINGPETERYGIDPLTQARRVLTFAIGGKGVLPPRRDPPPPAEDPGFAPDEASEGRGALGFAMHCATCHGSLAVASTQAPDLRRSPIPADRGAFAQIVHGGALEARGMPKFGEFPDGKLEDIRQYTRAQTAEMRGTYAGKAQKVLRMQ